jgi:thiamine pyrophosphate-dependent acetolactate synthase large subunit-like protein
VQRFLRTMTSRLRARQRRRHEQRRVSWSRHLARNPGSTEQPFLKNFPKDFQYVLGHQEVSTVTKAEGFAQAIREPVFVNLHASADTGNGMKKILRAK